MHARQSSCANPARSVARAGRQLALGAGGDAGQTTVGRAGYCLLDNETYSQQAASLAYYEGLGDAQWLCRYIPMVQSVTREQLQAVLPTRLLGWITLGQRPEGAQ